MYVYMINWRDDIVNEGWIRIGNRMNPDLKKTYLDKHFTCIRRGNSNDHNQIRAQHFFGSDNEALSFTSRLLLFSTI